MLKEVCLGRDERAGSPALDFFSKVLGSLDRPQGLFFKSGLE